MAQQRRMRAPALCPTTMPGTNILAREPETFLETIHALRGESVEDLFTIPDDHCELALSDEFRVHQVPQLPKEQPSVRDHSCETASQLLKADLAAVVAVGVDALENHLVRSSAMRVHRHR